MYVIIVEKDIISHRDSIISDIIGDRPIQQPVYLSKKSGSNKFSTTTALNFALIYKTESGAKRVIADFNSRNHYNNSRSRFYWITDRHLSFRKLTKEEYNSIIDGKISILDNTYHWKRNKLLSKKL